MERWEISSEDEIIQRLLLLNHPPEVRYTEWEIEEFFASTLYVVPAVEPLHTAWQLQKWLADALQITILWWYLRRLAVTIQRGCLRRQVENRCSSRLVLM